MRYAREWTNRPVRDFEDLYHLGLVPASFVENDDPERAVPLVFAPEDYMIAVSGDLLRTNAYIFSHNGILGFPVSHRIELPAHWPPT